MVVGPGVKVKPVERDALRPYGNLDEVGARLRGKHVLVHAEVGRRVAQPDEARKDHCVTRPRTVP